MMQMKNYLSFTCLLTALVVVGLGALYYLPPIEIGGHSLRKTDILSDLRPDMTIVADSDAIALPPPVRPVFIDTCKTGMTCIEDYSDSTRRGMSSFYQALIDRVYLERPVRIAYFGDSFIEADILTGDLRAMLQDRFGGSGVGYVSITSPIYGFRRTVKHSFDGWESHSSTDSVFFDRKRQDLSSHYFIPKRGAHVTLQGQSKYASHLDSCTVSSLFFRSGAPMRITARIDGMPVEVFETSADEALQCVSVSGQKMKQVKWTVEQADSLATFYGATMDDDSGVLLDNFSTRGSSGQQLAHVPFSLIKGYERFRAYDLIILHYGLNVAYRGGTDYSYYKESMKKVIGRIKQAFPHASILIVGVGDRENKDESGNLRTMLGIKHLIRYQQAMAAESGVAFWNLYEAMGGEGSMVKLVESTPAMANYDYTHINFRGGKHLAGIFFETLMYGMEQYERRIKIEAGQE